MIVTIDATRSRPGTDATTASSGVGLRSLAVLLDRSIGDAPLRALRAHLCTLPADVRVWAVRVTLSLIHI